MTLTEKFIAVHYSGNNTEFRNNNFLDCRSLLGAVERTRGFFIKDLRWQMIPGGFIFSRLRSMSCDYRVPVRRIHSRYLFIARGPTRGVQVSSLTREGMAHFSVISSEEAVTEIPDRNDRGLISRVTFWFRNSTNREKVRRCVSLPARCGTEIRVSASNRDNPRELFTWERSAIFRDISRSISETRAHTGRSNTFRERKIKSPDTLSRCF